MKSSELTIKHISKLSGFSVSTVSKALNDKSDVSEKVKLEIKSLAESVNYVPNSFALALRNGESKIIAVIVPQINSVFYSGLVAEIQHGAYGLGYQIMVLQSMACDQKELECINSVKSGFIDGLIIIRPKKKGDSIFFKKLIQLESNRIQNVILNVDVTSSNINKLGGVGKKSLDWLLLKMEKQKNKTQ